MKNNLLSNNKGSVMVEFTIALPILIIIFLGGFTIINMMKGSHDASSFARVVGNIVHAEGVDALNTDSLTNLAGENKFKVEVQQINCSNGDCKNGNVNTFDINNSGIGANLQTGENITLSDYIGSNEADITRDITFFRIRVCYNSKIFYSFDYGIKCETFYY